MPIHIVSQYMYRKQHGNSQSALQNCTCNVLSTLQMLQKHTQFAANKPAQIITQRFSFFRGGEGLSRFVTGMCFKNVLLNVLPGTTFTQQAERR